MVKGCVVAMAIASKEKWVTWFVSKDEGWRRGGGGMEGRRGACARSSQQTAARRRWSGRKRVATPEPRVFASPVALALRSVWKQLLLGPDCLILPRPRVIGVFKNIF